MKKLTDLGVGVSLIIMIIMIFVCCHFNITFGVLVLTLPTGMLYGELLYRQILKNEK